MGIFRLLGETGKEEAAPPAFVTTLKLIQRPLDIVMVGIIALVAIGAVVFSIWVGFRLAKAEDEGKRKDAKQQLLWAIIAVVASVLIFVLITTVFATSDGTPSVMGGAYDTMVTKLNAAKTEGKPDLVIDATLTALVAINQVIGILFSFVTLAAVGFAIYVGARLAMAQDEGKRKEAKQQLLWTIIAIGGAIVLSVIIGQIMVQLVGSIPLTKAP